MPRPAPAAAADTPRRCRRRISLRRCFGARLFHGPLLRRRAAIIAKIAHSRAASGADAPALLLSPRAEGLQAKDAPLGRRISAFDAQRHAFSSRLRRIARFGLLFSAYEAFTLLSFATQFAIRRDHDSHTSNALRERLAGYSIMKYKMQQISSRFREAFLARHGRPRRFQVKPTIAAARMIAHRHDDVAASFTEYA